MARPARCGRGQLPWCFEQVGRRRCPIVNISGGTEIIGCHLPPTLAHPALKACSLGGPALGMDVTAFTTRPAGPARHDGHLVCRQPALSMTKSFLHDDERYLETYFRKFPGHLVPRRLGPGRPGRPVVPLGRTDDTMKVAGKRVGPGEVEGALTAHAAVSEAAVIGVPDELRAPHSSASWCSNPARPPPRRNSCVRWRNSSASRWPRSMYSACRPCRNP